MTDQKHFEQRIVVDGQQRIIDENYARVAWEIRARYAESLSRSGWFGRMLLKIRIRREIERELKRIAPPGGLYLKT